jgi:hypothetical protein
MIDGSHECVLEEGSNPPRLTAILLNPPTGTGARTISHLRHAQRSLNCSSLAVGNLVQIPTAGMQDLSKAAARLESWLEARESLTRLLCGADNILYAWGVSPLRGPARLHLRAQIEWVLSQPVSSTARIWTLGGEPRHPSRWHQYLSAKYGRTDGGSFSDRISGALAIFPNSPLIELNQG